MIILAYTITDLLYIIIIIIIMINLQIVVYGQ